MQFVPLLLMSRIKFIINPISTSMPCSLIPNMYVNIIEVQLDIDDSANSNRLGKNEF